MPNATFVPLDGLNHATAINPSDAILPHAGEESGSVRHISGERS
jgi:hypothetical protein